MKINEIKKMAKKYETQEKKITFVLHKNQYTNTIKNYYIYINDMYEFSFTLIAKNGFEIASHDLKNLKEVLERGNYVDPQREERIKQGISLY